MEKMFIPNLAYQVVKERKDEAIKEVIKRLNADYNITVEDAIGDDDVNETDIIKYILNDTECPNNKDIRLKLFLHEVKNDYNFSDDKEDKTLEEIFDSLIELTYDSIDDFYGMEIVGDIDYNELEEFVKSNWDDEEEIPSTFTDSIELLTSINN